MHAPYIKEKCSEEASGRLTQTLHVTILVSIHGCTIVSSVFRFPHSALITSQVLAAIYANFVRIFYRVAVLVNCSEHCSSEYFATIL